ncbi:DUF4349 domain-containing protein [Baekduia sp. Peel2402]|uniref:DUF4349 domain-containing protein n=1 Tax=Baekduia sp. Peel2402 TaxID=3458296 RepID=UPI00403E7B67
MRRRDAKPDPEVDHSLRELEAALAGEPTADPDTALLVADVRAARPEPDPQFLASLDARVHAGFPKQRTTPEREKRASWHARLRQPLVVAPAVIAACAAVAVIAIGVPERSDDLASTMSGGGGEIINDSAAVTKGTPPLEPQAAESAPSQTASTPAAGQTLSAGSSSSARKVERAAELTLTPAPDEVQKTADGVIRETQANGGYVQESSIRTRDDGGSASFTLRIPSAKLDATLANLSKLAHVGALNQSSNDITAQTASAADRLSDARAERRALLQALGRATTDRQINSLKARLRDNRSEIAARQGELDAQRRRADLATVAVSIEGIGTAAPKDDSAWTPGDALHDAGRVLEVAGGVALIALAVLAPLGVLAVLALLGSHAVRRRRREGALDGV